MNRSQSALHVTDDSCMKEVLQLTPAFVTASNPKRKIYDSKSLKMLLEGGHLVTISLLKLNDEA